jgi:hypothetical protein
VRDFYRQGGATAVIVRAHKTKTGDTATITLGTGNAQLAIVAAAPGAWGSKLTATIDDAVATPSDTTLFNLTITDTATGRSEVFRNVSFAPASPRRVDLVLKDQSTLARMSGSLPTAPQASFPVTANASGGNDGDPIDAGVISTGTDFRANKKGLFALETVDLVNLLVIPPYTTTGEIEANVLSDAIAYVTERRAVMIIDPPAAWTSLGAAVTGASAASFTSSTNAAVYFPRIRQPDPLRDGQLTAFAPSGAIAGTIARTDGTRGVWKAPAGLDATLDGVAELDVPLTDPEIGRLNPLGVNCLRAAPGAGHVVWGARRVMLS